VRHRGGVTIDGWRGGGRDGLVLSDGWGWRCMSVCGPTCEGEEEDGYGRRRRVDDGVDT